MAKRIIYRNKKTVLETGFFEDSQRTIPTTPLNNSYPEYSIFDPSNAVVAHGIGQASSSLGKYKIEWIPPANSPLSTDTHKWRIEWLMVTGAGDSVTTVESFEMVDEIVDASQSLAQQILTLAASTTRVILKLTTEHAEVTCTLFQLGTSQTVYGPRTFSSGQVNKIMEDGGYVYYTDIPPNTLREGAYYQVVWEVRRTATSQTEHILDRLIAVSPRVIAQFPSVRMLIDKFQKRLGRIHGFEDADVYEYLEHGLRVVNGWHPATFYGINIFPPALDTFWIMAAAWWGLNAQYILEADMMFDFSGQTVTLTMDRTGALDSAIGRFNDFLTTNLTKAKTAIVRSTTPAGIVAVRPTRFNLLHQVFRVDRGLQITPSVADMVYSVFG